jgi:hypothetical protein
VGREHASERSLGDKELDAGPRDALVVGVLGRAAGPAGLVDRGAYRAGDPQFFGWYNAAHRHSGIAMMTPQAVHYGHAAQLHQARAQVLAAADAAHPERFVHRPPAPNPLPRGVDHPPESTQEATQ